jgi:hypothetical protein
MPPIKDLLSEIASAFKKRDQRKLRKINDKVLKGAVLEFNKQIYDVAVLSYVLSKLVSKPRYMRRELEEKMTAIDRVIADNVKIVSKMNEEEWISAFQSIEDRINDLDSEDPRFIRDMMDKGRLKVAATLYAQGLSLGLASEMTGMNKQDIQEYAGKTMMFDRVKEEQSIQERMKNARKLLEK